MASDVVAVDPEGKFAATDFAFLSVYQGVDVSVSHSTKKF